MSLNILLISTYEMGRQPFGLASPAAWLRQAGFEVRCLDLSIDSLDLEAVRTANLVAFYAPMHMATRMAVPVIAQVRQINPHTHLCCFGLYAPVNAPYLYQLGVETILGGEFETGLVALAQRIEEVKRRGGEEAKTRGHEGTRTRGSEDAKRRRHEDTKARGGDSTPPASPPHPLPASSPHPLPASPPHLLPASPPHPLPASPPHPLPASSPHISSPHPLISLDRQIFLCPDRTGLPQLACYAHLVKAEGQHVTVGYTEASRGCKHLCRHCPIVPVYSGRFRIVQQEVIRADIRQQVEAGAGHITFGDPDFFNGPGHAIPLVKALHQEFPHLTYDVTIKVEHLLKYAEYLPSLKKTGCLFITSAVESFDEYILAVFDKRHTRADFMAALNLCRRADLLLVPTFVAFTPWTTLEGYRAFLAEIVQLGLVDQVSPIQLAIRLLIPPGSKLLELPEVEALIEGLDEAKLSYTWRSLDPRVDELQRDLEYLVQRCAGRRVPRREVFRQVWERTFQASGDPAGRIPFPELPPATHFVPYLTEPWYC